MKNIKHSIGIFLALAILAGCEDEKYAFGDVIAPTNLVITADILGADAANPNGDGSGTVKLKATANDAITYQFVYDGETTVSANGTNTYDFSITGTHVYTITVIATGKAGVATSEIIEVEVLALYEAPDDLLEMLIGDGSKVWRINADKVGHFGVGPADETSPIWYAAPAGAKASTGMYDDGYNFSESGVFKHITNRVNDDPTEDITGTVFGQSGPMDEDLGDKGLTANSDNEYENYPLDDYTESWTLTAPGAQETLTLSGNAFLGFYVGGTHSYTIISRSEDEMVLKTISADGLGWFFILTSTAAVTETSSVDVTYSNLVWSDDFDTDGAVDAAKWGYDIGVGDNGWGNGESQYYTNSTDNSVVEGGILKITAKAETIGGSNYSSARLKTQGLYDFKYGRVDVRAKLPGVGGTWPAIWMLGANFETVGWPVCGEIDIMEHVGNNPGNVSAALHTVSSSGNTENFEHTTVSDATTEFHIYSVNWSENEISFLVDDEIFYTYNPADKNADNWPFDANQFLILNLALGGSLGGDIPTDFSTATFEIDYVKVYQ